MTLVERIREVWGDHDDFEEGGFPYVAFLIRQDLKDMEDDEWDEQECVEELADVCINAMRMLDERGYFPAQVISQRLDDHQMKGTDRLVSEYQERFQQSIAAEADGTDRVGPGWYVIEGFHQDPATVLSGPHDTAEDASRTASVFAAGSGRIMHTPALVNAIKNDDYNVEWSSEAEKPESLRA